MSTLARVASLAGGSIDAQPDASAASGGQGPAASALESDPPLEHALRLLSSPEGILLDRITSSGKVQPVLATFDSATFVLTCAPASKSGIVHTVDLAQLKEIRTGLSALDANKVVSPEIQEKMSAGLVLVHGTEFRLKVISLIAPSIKTFNAIVAALTYYSPAASPHLYERHLCLRRWLAKIALTRGKADARTVLATMNMRLSSKDTRELPADDIRALYERATAPPDALLQMFAELLHLPASPDLRISAGDLAVFLRDQKGEVLPAEAAQALINAYSSDGVSLTLGNLLECLFNSSNTIAALDTKQNMNFPLSHYYIYSSHNTYLMGDQLASESSVEAYIRVLRDGCRCIEVDCWDGPAGEPIVYHGHTITSKIRLADVLAGIRDHAFATSPYPICISLENHCSHAQQGKMAALFKEYLGPMLITAPLHEDAVAFPSPNQLRGRIMIKHRKGTAEAVMENKDDDADSETIKAGFLRVQDRVNPALWVKHFFVLTADSLSFVEAAEDRFDGNTSIMESIDPWIFHGVNGDAAARLLCRTDPPSDGVFLIRENNQNLALSYLVQGAVQHSRISVVDGLYALVDSIRFKTLKELVAHYRTQPLRAASFATVLTRAVAPPPDHVHEQAPWYYGALTRADAEALLLRVDLDGAFLVRKSSRDPNDFVITFRARHKVKHCLVRAVPEGFQVGDVAFDSILQLLDHYRRHPFYRAVRLRYPVDRSLVDRSEGPASCDASDSAELDMSEASEGEQEGDGFNGALGTRDVLLLTMSDDKAAPPGAWRIGNAKDRRRFVRVMGDEGDKAAWIAALAELQASRKAEQKDRQQKKQGIHKDLSALIYYLQTQTFESFDASKKSEYYKMSSFSEKKALAIARTQGREFNEYNIRKVSRIYPAGGRIDSSNFDPQPYWNVGCQMAALNCQTPDRPMWINAGRFQQNDRCGYVLKPDMQRHPRYDPSDTTSHRADPLKLSIKIIGARHLPRASRGLLSPFVEVAVSGLDGDNAIGVTSAAVDNGLCPVWNEGMEFAVAVPELACVVFAVQEKDMFGDPKTVGQACFFLGSHDCPLIRPGFRSVPLRNVYNEPMELAALLVHISLEYTTQLDADTIAAMRNDLRKQQMARNATSQRSDRA
eukprot:m.67266 g.67266  ORF g.67266 m.67266 type:complete len:1124 (-) comp7447_c0_seq1:68-3439(-)